MNTALLQQLNSISYVSGEVLATQFQCSRAAISKQVELLRAAGVLIESRSHHGYRLLYDYAWWQSDAVSLALQGAGLDEIQVLPTVDSTNTWMRQHLQTRSAGKALAISDFQRSGKGRRGKAWVSPVGRQLTFSVGISSAQPPLLWMGLALAVGVEVAHALRAINIPATLKWPNDIEIHGAKLGGILVEMEADFDGPSRVVVGLGLNEHLQDDERAALERDVVCLSDLGVAYERYQLLADLTARLSALLDRYPTQGLAVCHGQWLALDSLRDREVQFQQQDDWAVGIARGIDGQGCLLVETPEGVVRCHSGEVSVRGVRS